MAPHGARVRRLALSSLQLLRAAATSCQNILQKHPKKQTKITKRGGMRETTSLSPGEERHSEFDGIVWEKRITNYVPEY